MRAAGAGSGAKREEANSCQMQQELKMKLCRRYAGLGRCKRIEARGWGMAGEGQKYRLDRPVTSLALGARGCLFTGLLVAATISDKGASTVSTLAADSMLTLLCRPV